MSPVRIAFGLAAVGFLVWTHMLANRFGADGVRLETAQQALKQIERAQDQTRTMQEVANAAQENYQQAQSDIAVRDRRIRGLVDRLRDETPSAEQLAQHSLAAVSRYAAEADRDFAECRKQFAALGQTAAGAAAAAWVHREAWPTVKE